MNRPFLKCSLPFCNNTAGQHDKAKNKNKQVCDPHRKTKKDETDRYKLAQGCSNIDGHYGFECVSKTILDPATLDINHIDGNNMNRDSSNIEVLCKMCHTLVTIRSNHHKKPNEKRANKLAETGLFSW